MRKPAVEFSRQSKGFQQLEGKKNILLVCDYELKPERIGGMDRFFRSYDSNVREIGHQISWIFRGGKNYGFYSGMDVRVIQGNFVEETLQFIDSAKIDVIVTHFIDPCTSLYEKLKKRSGAYCIAVDHNPRPLGGFSVRKRIKKRMRGILYSKHIDLFVGVSEYTRRCILQDFGGHLREKTVVIYNGVDTDVYIKKKEEQRNKYIVASHLRPSKGIEDLIRAVLALPDDVKAGVQFDIYGEGPLEYELKEMVKTFRLQDQINFKGSSSELPELFCNYSYLVQPTYMECLSLSILESLAANVPVLTTPVGGNPEIIEDGRNGFFFAPGDTEGLALFLQQINKKELSISGDVSQEIEEKFHLKRMVREHINLLSHI